MAINTQESLLQKAAEGRRLEFDEAVELYRHADLLALGQAAQAARLRQIPEKHVTYLIDVRADDDDGSFGCVAGDGAEPEIEAGVLVAQANVPQQQVHGAIRQEKLQHNV